MIKDTITEQQKLILTKKEILKDYYTGWLSRQLSLIGRKEVLSGKAKFGIFGDGKELAQIALSKVFEKGDFRSGYYRDQTLMLALGLLTPEQFFAQLYAHPESEFEPHSRGRQMNAHFSTPTIDNEGNWIDVTKQYNSVADVSSTSAQMPHALGIGMASKYYRAMNEKSLRKFSNKGKEIAFVTIGDASTSEGHFWETVNACGVLDVPVAISVWDDGYGISVPKEFQTTKGSISEALSGFAIDEKGKGIHILKARGWNYTEMIDTYRKGIQLVRNNHKTALFHIDEVTQPQGHSTSGSHERYKSKDRLQWEIDFDCLVRFKSWIIEEGIATISEVEKQEKLALERAQEAKKTAWVNYRSFIQKEQNISTDLLGQLSKTFTHNNLVQDCLTAINSGINPGIREVLEQLRRLYFKAKGVESNGVLASLKERIGQLTTKYQTNYQEYLYSQSEHCIGNIDDIPAVFSKKEIKKSGYEILNQFFDHLFATRKDVVAFGEDVGQIGDVNQGFMGLQAKHGVHRIFDTGIREASIIGQGIGMAMRGLRPIAEIQYLDYFIFGMQPIVDDLATLLYRSAGTQKAPLIVRTRGHRLEGIWHTGSPMAMILNSVKGVYLCVPRNMTQAVGMYNCLLKSDEPGIVIECLNGYRLKELVPENLNDYTVSLGIPETLIEGSDVTLLTYGSCVRIAQQAIDVLATKNISVELIDVQTLLPFDRHYRILDSLKKTNRIVFFDEDVPGGATSFMMQKVLEEQDGYHYLDSKPLTITAVANRVAFGSDGDYFCKPQVEDVVEGIYGLMNESNPTLFPAL